jgi:predicted ArsR family transcriptional regulator
MTTRSPDDNVSAVGLLHEPTRRRLYEWVSGEGRSVGRDAAAAGLGISRSLAAFHLDRLVEAGLLDAGYRRLSGRTGPGAGRPARVYWRGDREVSVSLPERHYERAAQLFAAALENENADSPRTALREGATAMGAELGRAGAGRRGTTGRLLNVLQDAGYEPVPTTDGVIRLRNCPFDALVDEHRSLVCGTNLALAEGITSGSGTSQYRPVLDKQSGYCCVAFVMQAREA